MPIQYDYQAMAIHDRTSPLAARVARQFLASRSREAAIQNINKLSDAQKKFIKQIGDGLKQSLSKMKGVHFQPSGVAETQWQAGKAYVRDGFGRKSPLAGVPHAKLRLYLTATSGDFMLTSFPTLEILISQDGTLGFVKDDRYGGRSTKGVKPVEIGASWGNDVEKMTSRWLKEISTPAPAPSRSAPSRVKPSREKIVKEDPGKGIVQKALKSAAADAKRRASSISGVHKLETKLYDNELDLIFKLDQDKIFRASIVVEMQPDGQSTLILRLHLSTVFNVQDDVKKVSGSAKEVAQKAPQYLDEVFALVQQAIQKISAPEVWSVVSTGRRDSYAKEIQEYGSKEEAMEAAQDLGDCYVVKGTQMWNEPIGQVEEHNRVAWYTYVPGDSDVDDDEFEDEDEDEDW